MACFLRKVELQCEGRIFFWEDDWLGIGSLKQLYPDKYNLTTGSTLDEVWSTQGWYLTFIRMMHVLEMNRLSNLFSTLEQCKGLQEGKTLSNGEVIIKGITW